ncbi:glycoside hydrolase domain-containing protein [Streptomyces sp. NPDC053427]|uniref:glycoside hydrolase domain-containing protein n=1 Tax=Streptomyces sp. NPDC053427 TaxID=3365701 RepID=UPI0037D5D43E
MFGGLDKDNYASLGDAVMGPVRAYTNLRWTGFYLCHQFDATGSSWTAPHSHRVPPVSTWRFLRSEGWGLGPLYLGRQWLRTPNAAGHMVSVPNPGWSEANGKTDGQHAVELAKGVEMENGATIYIDLELDGFMNDAEAKRYLKGWFAAVTQAGYRPGAYCWDSNDARKICTTFRDVAIWFIRMPEQQPTVYNESDGMLFRLPPAADFVDPEEEPGQIGRVACQFAWYNQERGFPGAKLRTSPTTLHEVNPIDFDAARMPDPSHPEAKTALCLTDFGSNAPAAFFLDPSVAAWQFLENGRQWGDWMQGGIVTPEAVTFKDLGYGRWFDTASVAAASRKTWNVDLFGLGVDGSLWTTRLLSVGDDLPWSEPQVLNSSTPARHGSAIAAVSRRTDVLDVFFFNTAHELTTTWWAPGDPDWQAHVGAISHGFSFAPGTNIAALTSPTDSERLDLFAVDSSNTVRWVQWRTPAPWATASVPLAEAADPAVGVHAIWSEGQIHLLVGTRSGRLAHLVHPDGTQGGPSDWSTVGFVPRVAAQARPMAARVTRFSGAVVAVVIDSLGILSWSAYDGVNWTVPGTDVPPKGYSTGGRLAVTVTSPEALDVLLPDQKNSWYVRRLVPSGVPAAPLTTGELWAW